MPMTPEEVLAQVTAAMGGAGPARQRPQAAATYPMSESERMLMQLNAQYGTGNGMPETPPTNYPPSAPQGSMAAMESARGAAGPAGARPMATPSMAQMPPPAAPVDRSQVQTSVPISNGGQMPLNLGPNGVVWNAGNLPSVRDQMAYMGARGGANAGATSFAMPTPAASQGGTATPLATQAAQLGGQASISGSDAATLQAVTEQLAQMQRNSPRQMLMELAGGASAMNPNALPSLGEVAWRANRAGSGAEPGGANAAMALIGGMVDPLVGTLGQSRTGQLDLQRAQQAFSQGQVGPEREHQMNVARERTRGEIAAAAVLAQIQRGMSPGQAMSSVQRTPLGSSIAAPSGGVTGGTGGALPPPIPGMGPMSAEANQQIAPFVPLLTGQQGNLDDVLSEAMFNGSERRNVPQYLRALQARLGEETVRNNIGRIIPYLLENYQGDKPDLNFRQFYDQNIPGRMWDNDITGLRRSITDAINSRMTPGNTINPYVRLPENVVDILRNPPAPRNPTPDFIPWGAGNPGASPFRPH